MIKSPGWIFALSAGVSSIGETTFTKPSSIVTSIPSPPNAPLVWTCISSKSSSSINDECGSRLANIPLIADFTKSLSGTSST